MHFHGLVVKEVVGKIMCKHRGFSPETMYRSSLEDKNRLLPL